MSSALTAPGLRRRAAAALALGSAALVAAGCGGSGGGATRTTTVERTRVEVVTTPPASDGAKAFDPAAIYAREAPGVVTVISVFGSGGGSGSQGGLGSGFVLDPKGEIVTNAHVVTTGKEGSLRRARSVYVQFADGNQVPARIVGTDPDADVALLDVDPAGLTLRPLPLGSSANLVVGSPVAAIGSPFGEPQSLSVGVVSATDRSIQSLTKFQISGAIQTDAAINHGNSGGPLVGADGRVIGINSQIESSGGGGEGVGFAVPIDTVKHSIDQLRAHGAVRYAYLGISTVPLYPQLARDLGIPADHGAFIQTVTPGSPAARAGLRGGDRAARFQDREYCAGGDVIVSVAGRAIERDSDVSEMLARYSPGQRVTLRVYRGSRARDVRVRLGERPAGGAAAGSRGPC